MCRFGRFWKNLERKSSKVFVCAVTMGVIAGLVSAGGDGGGSIDAQVEGEEWVRGTIRNLSLKEALARHMRRLVIRALLRLAVKVMLVVLVVWAMEKVLGRPEGVGPLWFFICSVDEQVRFENRPLRVIQKGDATRLEFLMPHVLEISKSDWQASDVEMVRLARLKTMDGKKLLTQAQIGRAFGISRQMVNRRVRLVEEFDMESLLRGEHEKWKLSPGVMKRIGEIVVSDWHRTDSEIAGQLVEEGLVDSITQSCVRLGVKKLDGLYLRTKLRKILGREGIVNEYSRDYLIEKLMELVEDCMRGKQAREPQVKAYEEIKGYCEVIRGKPVEKRGRYRRDVKVGRVYERQEKQRKVMRLARIVQGETQEKVICPDCASPDVVKKEVRVGRRFKDVGGSQKQVEAVRMYCKNPGCPTKTFTLLPMVLERWARVSKGVKRKALKLVVCVRGTLRRAACYLAEEENLSYSWTTILWWIRKAGRECVELEKVVRVRWSGKLVVDEKWVKLLGRWVYVYKAVDAVTGETLTQEVFGSLGKESAKTFLLKVKALGYRPDVVVTDLNSDYDRPVGEVFPGVLHHQCALHAERRAKELLREHLPEGQEYEALGERLRKAIRGVFEQEDVEGLRKSYASFVAMKSEMPDEVSAVFGMMQRYYPKLERCVREVGIPRTTNAVENAIKEFDIKYQSTFGFTSLYAISDFLKVYTIFERLTPRATGPAKGKSPRALSGDELAITWVDWVLAA